MGATIKTSEQQDKMRTAGRATASVLDMNRRICCSKV